MDPETLAWTGFALGLLGAGAWIPHVREWLRKPAVRVLPAEALEVSYLDVGAIINISCAFASLNKSALITSIDLSVQHSQGHRLEFRCVGLNETTSMSSNTGMLSKFDRTSFVPAIALGADASVERMIWFREKTGTAKRSELFHRIVPLTERLIQAHGKNWDTVMAGSAEFAEFRELIRVDQPWQAGRYSATMLVRVAQLRRPLIQTFAFDLSDADIRNIRANIALADNYIINLLLRRPIERPTSWAFAQPLRQ